ncbi:substrate-binding domain-containing protein [Arthrobacter sp. B10-11]|uniref:substrate-binding domain-containing protein n=1 Tax=Arthrobacter sp. B10-11 TaxID=3081160 RepID=UPI002953ACDC|nr:substrate-binding domain-containing protein [Arthrobacter sp. B10-11]MDV8146086.1 substrate-binding domain-containing protein [Arthrobacter sp. B10-11]
MSSDDNGSPRVSLFCAAALKSAVESLGLESLSTEIGATVDITYASTNVLVQRIDGGARPDVMIGMSGSLQALATLGVLVPGTIVPLAKSGIGIAASPDREQPDISTVRTLAGTLTAAGSVAYSRNSPSGLYFQTLITKLGIADEVNSRATLIDHGPTAAAVIDGRADLAVQQISELLHVPGARVIGPLPDSVQHYTDFSVALTTPAAGKSAAEALTRFLTGPQAKTAYADAGLDVS